MSSTESWRQNFQNSKNSSEIPVFYSHNTDYVAFQNNIQQGVPLEPRLEKIELFSKRLFDLKNPKEIPGTPSYTPCVEGPSDPLIKRYPLQLIGFSHKTPVSFDAR